MEATALSVGKSVLTGALGYAKSALAEEVALQLGVQRDQAFIRDELEMMLAFLMAAHEERDEHKVVKTWVKQVRDVAYDVEDSLQDFAVRLIKPSWWRILRMVVDRHNVAKQMKELRAKVEDVSQRNLRYRLIRGPDTNPASSTGQSSMTACETMSGIEEESRQKDKAKVDLFQLMNNKDMDLKVIAVWGTNGVLGQTPTLMRAYDDLKRTNKFECYAWIRIMHPFNPHEFLECIMRELYANAIEEAEITQEKVTLGSQVLKKIRMMKQDDLVHEFNEYVNEKCYLIVLNDVATVEEWNWIKTYFPNKKKGCRIIVSTGQRVVASLCLGKERLELELKQSSADQNIYAFCDKDMLYGTDSLEAEPSSNPAATDNNNLPRLARTQTMMAASLMESQLVGRMNEKRDIMQLISNNGSQQLEVISIYGMGGLGKTTLVKHVYQSQELSTQFDKRACVTIKRPFDPEDLLSSLAMQLGDTGKTKVAVGPSLSSLLQGHKYLIVLDDVSSTTEWDAIREQFPSTETSRIIITTRVKNIAEHCSGKDRNIYKLEFLGDKDAHDLFTKKVFGEITDLEQQYPELAEEAKLVLKKCNGLPLPIVSVGGFLSNQKKTPMEWRKFNEHISAELEMNPRLGKIRNILVKSYDGLPYHLKSCFLYLSIFPEDYNIRRRRLVQRWAAEGYSSEVRGKSMEEIADSYFMELIDRSMILPLRESIGTRKGIDSCQIHDLVREISISKSMDENLVFRLEEGCCSNAQGKIRHVAISSNWKGDKSEFESAVDLSHVRSLTVFAEWRPFFISEKMSLLRVLDLEDTSSLVDHHLVHIGRLLHLKYVSLRRCRGIYHLPDLWGNLQQLETLDIKGTRICKLPKAITKLKKLQYLFGGERRPACVYPGNRLPLNLGKLCMACCAPKFLKDVECMDGDPNRCDVCSFWCHVVFPTLASRRLEPRGVVLPRGIEKLKSLRTLGVVNIRNGKAILEDIRRLTLLRKLAVNGIDHKTCQELCSTLAHLSRLESLTMKSREESGLHEILDGVSSPPKNLQSLKLNGNLAKLPEWIGGLQSLVKLRLCGSKLTEVDATMQVLGKLPNLAILQLWANLFKRGDQLMSLTFHREALFPSLMVLELYQIGGLRSVEFKDGATPKLELLSFFGRLNDEERKPGFFSGLASLQSLKEFTLDNNCSYEEGFLKDVREQLAGNPNGSVLIRKTWWNNWTW